MTLAELYLMAALGGFIGCLVGYFVSFLILREDL